MEEHRYYTLSFLISGVEVSRGATNYRPEPVKSNVTAVRVSILANTAEEACERLSNALERLIHNELAGNIVKR
jgi:hypothetical protein